MILVGEMRDLETIATALTAAETSHLVLGTLHTQSASSTVDRIIDVFPPSQQEQVRMQIAGSLGDHHAGAAPDSRRQPATASQHSRAAARRRDLEPDPPGKGRADLTRSCRPEPRRACRRWSSRSRADAPPRDHARDCTLALEPPGPAARSARTRGLRHERRVCGARRICGDARSAAAYVSVRGIAVDEQSIWKKEISFREKKDARAAGTDRTSSSRPSRAVQQSIWKKEIFVTP